jgi:hypothetical protein
MRDHDARQQQRPPILRRGKLVGIVAQPDAHLMLH